MLRQRMARRFDTAVVESATRRRVNDPSFLTYDWPRVGRGIHVKPASTPPVRAGTLVLAANR